MADQTTISNHAIPQFHLRRWSADGNKIWTYQLLVPHEKVPRWKLRSIEYSSAKDHLYTSALTPEDPDHFEDWVKREVEDPAVEPIAKLLEKRTLTDRESHRVTRFVMALSVRTPAEYARSMERWSGDVKGILASVLAGLPAAMRRAKREGRSLVDSASGLPKPLIPLRAWTRKDAATDKVELHAAVSVGRALWIHNMKHVLTETVRAIGPVKWSVMEPYGDSRWFTSDDPVIRLDFNNPDDYDCFAGGWGRKGSEVLVPLSPTVLLYRQAGHSHPPVMQATAEQTLLVQRFVAEHAFREIYAIEATRRAETLRGRLVDASAYKREQKEWAEWNDSQSAAELDPREST